jgi:hypothetical protein
MIKKKCVAPFLTSRATYKWLVRTELPPVTSSCDMTGADISCNLLELFV